MGLEARCKVTRNRQSWTASVHLDSAAIQVRGRPAIEVAFSAVRRAQVRRGQLVIETADDGVLTLELGDAASTWADKINNPRSRIAKLGVKLGQRVSVVGVDDPALPGEIAAAGAQPVSGSGRADVVFFAAHAGRDLARLAALRKRIEPDGAIWVIRTKGKAAVVKEGEVLEAAKAAGLVAVKVVAFSDSLSADKLVIPLAQRGGKKKA